MEPESEDKPTALNFRDDQKIIKRKGYFLPHWTRERAIYHIVFRLRDSLPAHIVAQMKEERWFIDSQEVRSDLQNRQSDEIENLLDMGLGECLLKEPGAAEIVVSALSHFNLERYRLHAWCVMPNHVHVVSEPIAPIELDAICHSWKSFASHQINRLLKRTGSIWQKESYDRIIRTEKEYQHAVAYVISNPAKAHLRNWPWVFPNEQT